MSLNDETSLTDKASILSEAASKDRFNKEASMMRLQLGFLCKSQLVAILCGSLNTVPLKIATQLGSLNKAASMT